MEKHCYMKHHTELHRTLPTEPTHITLRPLSQALKSACSSSYAFCEDSVSQIIHAAGTEGVKERLEDGTHGCLCVGRVLGILAAACEKLPCILRAWIDVLLCRYPSNLRACECCFSCMRLCAQIVLYIARHVWFYYT
jgi:hypothetical protein